MERRVAITGIGCLSPNGNGREAFARSLCAGRSGVDRISLFDPEGLAATIAGEVKDFDPAAHLDVKSVRHVSRAVPLAIAASAEALEDAGIEPESALPRRAPRRWACCSAPAAARSSSRSGCTTSTTRTRSRRPRSTRSPRARSARCPRRSRCASACAGRRRSSRRAARRPPTRSATRSAPIKFGTADVVLTGGVDATVVRGIMEGFLMMRVVSTGWEREPRARLAAVLRRPRRLRARRGGLDVRPRGARARARRGAPASTPRSAATARPATRTTACGIDETGEEPARAMALALREAEIPPEADRVRRLPRHVDRAERPRRDAGGAQGLRRARRTGIPARRSSR